MSYLNATVMGEFVKRFSGIEKQAIAKTRHAPYRARSQ